MTSPNLEVLLLLFKKKTFLENKKYISLRVQRWEDFHLGGILEYPATYLHIPERFIERGI